MEHFDFVQVGSFPISSLPDAELSAAQVWQDSSVPGCAKRLLAATRCPHLSPALHQPSPESPSDFLMLCVWRRQVWQHESTWPTGGRWQGVSGQGQLHVSQIDPATTPSPSDIPPALPSFTHSHPRLRQHRLGFLQRRARRLTARGRARPHRARWAELLGPLDRSGDGKCACLCVYSVYS